MARISLQILAGVLVVVFVGPGLVAAQHKTTAAARRKTPDSQKVRSAISMAMSAGPAAISKRATIIGCVHGVCADMNELAKGPAKQLRAGTNGWVCFPLGDGPMCLDK